MNKTTIGEQIVFARDYSLAILPFAAICLVVVVGFVVLYARHRLGKNHKNKS